MLIAGDTASDRLQGRRRAVCFCHKSVAEIKLRATVGNLMRANAS
ncbi:MAG TPA: hypothetical protein VGG86_12395 [Roseiarcus sp.]